MNGWSRIKHMKYLRSALAEIGVSLTIGELRFVTELMLDSELQDRFNAGQPVTDEEVKEYGLRKLSHRAKLERELAAAKAANKVKEYTY